MRILAIRTDRPEAELGLFDNSELFDELKWRAGRNLSLTILAKITELLKKNGLDFHKLDGIAVYKGPGSFTGLRIGISVANTLAYGLRIPVASAASRQWPQIALDKLLKGENEQIVLPKYGGEPNISRPKK